jgi:ABC-type Fe3+-hydroxamate transport system substrate-binding protein
VTAQPTLISDDAGRPFRLDTPPRRIVSLVPSLTEMLFALGVGNAVVAVTRYCTEPPDGVAALPKVGGTKNPDIGAIVALRPDLVVINAEENRREDFEALSAAGLRLFVTEPKTVADAIGLIARLGAAVGRADEGARLAASQADAIREVAAAAADRPSVPYFCPIWRKPWMAFNADTYAHDVLRLAGGRNVVADRGERYPVVQLEEIVAADPAVVLLPDEPYRFSARDLPALAPLAATRALRRRQTYLVDGKALSWYGPRIASAVASFARIFAAV